MNSSNPSNIQELQVLEHNLQSLQMKKQSFQLELNEVSNALSELKDSGDEVYRVISGIMLKTKKPEIEKELKEKKDIFNLRISSIEKQEVLVKNKVEDLRKEIISSQEKK
jgi:prefoldin beta subunit